MRPRDFSVADDSVEDSFYEMMARLADRVERDFDDMMFNDLILEEEERVLRSIAREAV